MKRFQALAVLMTLAAVCGAGEIRQLPAPRKSGDMSVQEALNSRQSVRKFKAESLSDQQLSDILWCANGVNRPNGKRTAPSAMDRREVMIFAALPDGTYYYDAAAGVLVKKAGDLRKYCGKFAAPCYLILVPDRAKQNREIFAAVDTGYVSQNIYLAARSLGLGTCAMGSIIDRGMLKKELDLGKNEPFLVHPVGIPE